MQNKLVDIQKRSPKEKIRLFGIFFVIILLFITTYILEAENTWTMILKETIVPITINTVSAFLILFLGIDAFQALLEQNKLESRYKNVIKFWTTGKKQTNFEIRYGGELGSFKDDENIVTSLGTVYSIFQIQKTFTKIFPSSIIISQASLKERRPTGERDNIIILGGMLSLKKYLTQKDKEKERDTSIFIRQLPWQQNPEGRRSFSCTCGAKSEIETKYDDIDPSKISCDVASLTIFRENNRYLYWFNGNFALGTFGSVLFATNPHLSNDELELPLENGKCYQYIIQTNSITNNSINFLHNDIICEHSRKEVIIKNVTIKGIINDMQRD